MADQPTKLRPGMAHPNPAQEAQMPPEEILLGRYRVLARRGTGGFGTVCTCWDTRLQRRVAIKRLPLMDADNMATTTAEEALAEARTACMLAHPNIVAVHDFESDGTYAYLVMEYVDGLNLAELLARVEGGTLTYEECAHVLESVTRALAFAHENRVLHLDIKPTNIMVDRQGTVKLADFGMSTLASAAGYGGARGGTVGYMPPEQVEGMIVDERADVFSLAVVVWQALTGTDPFLAPTAAASCELIRRGPVRALSRDCPELAGVAEQALANALSPSPTERPGDVNQLAADLLPCLGSPADGQASLKDLVNQDEKPDETAEIPWEKRRLPWRVDTSMLEAGGERALAGLVTFAIVRQLLPGFAGATDQFVVVAALACTTATILWPPAGSALVGAALSWVVATTLPTTASFPLAAAIFAVIASWWLAAGRFEHLATPAALLPSCQVGPFAGAQVAAFGLDPLPAALTSVVSLLASVTLSAAVAANFSAQVMLASMLPILGQPAFWLYALGAALSAAVASGIALRGTVAAQIVGQGAGLAGLIATAVLISPMENAGIWAIPTWEVIALAILWFVFLCIAAVLRGPLFEDQEGEDLDELPQ